MRFSSAVVLVSFITAALCATITDVKNDIAQIYKDVTGLEQAIDGFSDKSTLADAFVIHASAIDLVGTIKTATVVLNSIPPPVSEVDANDVVQGLSSFQPVIESALVQLAANKGLLTKFPSIVIQITKDDLASLRSTTFAFATALLAIAPPDLVAYGTDLRGRIDENFAVAEAAYYA